MRREERRLLVGESGRGALGVSVELVGEVGVVEGGRVRERKREVCPVHLGERGRGLARSECREEELEVLVEDVAHAAGGLGEKGLFAQGTHLLSRELYGGGQV